MAQQSLQTIGGVLNAPTLTALGNNFNDLYAYYGVAAGEPFSVNRFVDGDTGSDTNDGLTPTTAKKTIQGAIDASGQGDRVFIKPLEAESASGDTDPDSYTEALTITAKDGLQLIGVGRGLGQGAQPQLKIGSVTTSPLITINSFGVGIFNLTINGAGATGGGIKLVANGSTIDAGGAYIANCHFKNCKSTAAAATGGAVYWSTNGGCWYVTINNCEFFDCRAGVVLTGTSIDSPKGVKILNCRFWAAVNTTVDADIYGGGSGWAGIVISGNDFGTVDVPAYASSPDAARYIKMLGGAGIIARNAFACNIDSKTFGAGGDGAIIPTTFRMAGNYGEGATASTHGFVFRT
jgi:hypothetical protein